MVRDASTDGRHQAGVLSPDTFSAILCLFPGCERVLQKATNLLENAENWCPTETTFCEKMSQTKDVPQPAWEAKKCLESPLAGRDKNGQKDGVVFWRILGYGHSILGVSLCFNWLQARLETRYVGKFAPFIRGDPCGLLADVDASVTEWPRSIDHPGGKSTCSIL